MLAWKRFKSCNADKRGINQGNVAISSYVGKQVLFHSVLVLAQDQFTFQTRIFAKLLQF